MNALVALEQVADVYHREGQLDAALRVIGLGMPIALEADAADAELKYRLWVLHWQGEVLITRIYQSNCGYEQARANLTQVCEQCVDEEYPDLPRALDMIGLSYCYEAMHAGTKVDDRARGYFERALGLDRREHLLEYLSSGLYHLGLFAELHGELDVAEDYYRKAHAVAHEHDCSLDLSHTHQHFGTLAMARGDLDSARGHFEKSLELRTRLGRLVLVPPAHTAVASVSMAQGDIATAERHARQALRLASRQDAPLSLTMAHLAMGDVVQAQGESAKALRHYRVGHKVAAQHRFAQPTRDIEARLARLNALAND